MSNGPHSIYATPSRTERTPFPQSTLSPAHLHRRQVTSSATLSTSSLAIPNSSTATPSVSKDRTLTSASLLRLHAGTPDPKVAALEQAVNERNTLSAQNAQLWKLIEKQRAGYNQIFKELERIRGERDAFKVRLGLSSSNASGRNDGNRSTSHSVDENPLTSHTENGSSNSDHSSSNPRQAMARHDPNDQPAPRSQHPSTLHSSRSHEPLSPRERDPYSSPTTSRSQVLPPPPASAPSVLDTSPSEDSTRSQKHPPKPLTVPPPLNLSSSISASPAIQSTFSHDPSSIQIGNSDLRPMTYPRKSSLVEGISSGLGASTVTRSHLSSAVSHGPSVIPQLVTTSASSLNPPKIVTGLATPSDGMLSTIGEGSRPQILSRESRVSLPDEAKQYIANMTDSPIASPRVDAFVAKFGAASRSAHPHIQIPDNASLISPGAIGEEDSPGGTKEFLDMRDENENENEEEEEEEDKEEDEEEDKEEDEEEDKEEDEEEDIEEDEDEGKDEDEDEDDGFSAITVPEADADSEILPVSSIRESIRSQVQSHQSELPAELQGRDANSHSDVDEFPLPPSIAHPQGQQAMDQAQLEHLHRHSASQVQHPNPEMMTTTHTRHQQMLHSAPPPYSSTDRLENPYSPPGQSQHHQQPLRMDSHHQPLVQTVPASFRALPLLSSDLPHTTITVSHSFVRPNDRGKEVLSFVVYVDPGKGKDGWKVEKMYSDVLGLDQRVRSSVAKGVGKKIASLPEGKLWKDHAPAKVDQRKAVLENYLQTLINLPVKNKDEVIAFFTSDIMREAKQPVMQAGHKEGYLTKRGKNFGGWKTRYFVLQGPVLEYYDCRGGAHLGSITITGAQIGRQQRSDRTTSSDEEKEYRHAFLIVEAKKLPGGSHPRHVLCAESDEDRDSWVEMLVRYFSGTYSEEPVKYGPSPIAVNALSTAQSRTSIGSNESPSSSRRPVRGLSKDDISISKGAAVPISQLALDPSNAKLFQPAPQPEDYTRSSSPTKSMEPSPIDGSGAGAAFEAHNRHARRILERGQGQPSSLPDTSPLSAASPFPSEPSIGQRANSELGHYPDLLDHLSSRPNRHISPERHRIRDPHAERKFLSTLNAVQSAPVASSHTDRIPSPDKLDANNKVKISGPMNGTPIPSGFKFGKDVPSVSEAAAAERRAKSRSFWGFGKANGDKSNQPTHVPRAVFGVPLEEALDVAQIANLPAIVFRCIQYLEAKKADQEEGIYRLSGSSAVIKSLKDRFNMEGDVDLLASDEYWDPHAIAGLLKSFLRELPASILTRDLHLRFLAVIDFVDPQERIRELSHLIAALPITNYSLLRALTAHLILIVQNSGLNKMTMRNVGIVFSPTLGIPAGVFSLMLGEFNRVFNVDPDIGSQTGDHNDGPLELHPRNSRQYSDAAADQLLGLAGRTLKSPAEETQSDGDDFFIQEESGTETTEGDFPMESSSESIPAPVSEPSDLPIRSPPDTPIASKMSRASNVAATRGLNVSATTVDRSTRQSRMNGLPSSPRLPLSPARAPDTVSSPTLSRND